MQRLRHSAAELADMVYPRSCAICQNTCTGPGRYICWTCQGQIEYHSIQNFCNKCGRSFPGVASAPFTCLDCRKRQPAYTAARSTAHFSGPVRDLLHIFKYRKGSWLAEDLTRMLEACVQHHFPQENIEIVCPIPLHNRRQRERGYNQSQLLGKRLAERLDIPCFGDLLRRTRYTRSQTFLTADERWRNAQGIFAVNPLLKEWLRERTVLVVDDVMTTGATVESASRTLLRGGAGRVLVATVARD